MNGQIEPRGDKKWLIKVYLGEVDGKRKYKSRTIHGTKKQAEAALREWVREIETGSYVEPSKETVGQLLDRWLRDWASDNVGPTSYERYESFARLHVKPEIGGMPLAKLNTLIINDLYARKRAEGLSPATIRTMHAVIKGALKSAVRWRLLSTNPADGADLPRVDKEGVKALTPDQARTLLQVAAASPWYTAILLGLTTGMRRGEICALRWSDVNFDDGSLSVRHTLARTKENGLFLKPCKTRRSARRIELSDQVVKDLRHHRVAQTEARLKAGEKWQDNDLVVCRNDGTFLPPTDFNGVVKRLMKRAGVPNLSSHALRHTAATLMLQQEVHPKVVQERLGHSTITITMDLYSHVLPGIQREAASRLEGVLLGAGGGRKRASGK